MRYKGYTVYTLHTLPDCYYARGLTSTLRSGTTSDRLLYKTIHRKQASVLTQVTAAGNQTAAVALVTIITLAVRLLRDVLYPGLLCILAHHLH